MRTKIENERKILLKSIDLGADEHAVNTSKLSEGTGLDNVQAETAFNRLVEHGLLKIKINVKWKDMTFETTTLGEDIAEEWRNDERWNKTLGICENLDAFSFDLVMAVLRDLISKDIKKAVDEMPA
jgi:predicted transcriptional regulator